MKILILGNKNIFYVEGAYSNRLRSLIEGLAKRDVVVHVIITQGNWEPKEYIFHKNYNYPKNIVIHYLGYPYQIRVLKKLKYQDTIKRLLIKKQRSLQKQIKFDYGWINFGFAHDVYLESISLFKSEGIKIIQEISEFPMLFISKPEYKKYLDLICPQIDIMFLMTKDLLNFYKKLINRDTKLFHIPMTVDFNRFRNVKSHDNKNHIVSYVGLMNNKKDGVDLLIKAFILVVEEFPDARLQLIGPKYPQKDYLEQLEIIEKSNLKNHVKYLGKISREKIPGLLINSDCLVLARPDSKQAQYGFPTKLGEYLATGNPVVVTSVGEIPYYLKDNFNAYVTDPDNVTNFAFKILSVLRDKSGAKKIGAKGFETANEHFNADKQSNKIMKILEYNLNIE